ncbi:peptidoglycan editing factor PgeF [Patescibacteria group bacterium]
MKSFEKLYYSVFTKKRSMKDAALKNLVSLNQVHGDSILKVDSANQEIDGDYDAVITNKKDVNLVIRVADCQAVSIYDPVREVVANIHNGWKGSVKNIVGKTIKKMESESGCDPKDMYVWISPSLGPCHAEFSDPLNELPENLHKYILENNHVDFWKMTKDQCVQEGILENHIEMPTQCTVCHSDIFYSYRASKGGRDRFEVVIGMKD